MQGRDRRAAIRRTWKRHTAKLHPEIAIKFFLSQPANDVDVHAAHSLLQVRYFALRSLSGHGHQMYHVS